MQCFVLHHGTRKGIVVRKHVTAEADNTCVEGSKAQLPKLVASAQ